MHNGGRVKIKLTVPFPLPCMQTIENHSLGGELFQPCWKQILQDILRIPIELIPVYNMDTIYIEDTHRVDTSLQYGYKIYWIHIELIPVYNMDIRNTG